MATFPMFFWFSKLKLQIEICQELGGIYSNFNMFSFQVLSLNLTKCSLRLSVDRSSLRPWASLFMLVMTLNSAGIRLKQDMTSSEVKRCKHHKHLLTLNYLNNLWGWIGVKISDSNGPRTGLGWRPTAYKKYFGVRFSQWLNLLPVYGSLHQTQYKWRGCLL